MAPGSVTFPGELPLRSSQEQYLDGKPDVKHSQARQAIIFASWDLAVTQLKEELTLSGSKRSSTRLEDVPHANFKDVVQAATSAAEKTAAKRFRSTPTLQRVLATVNRFAVIGDLLVQHHAEYTSLVWGAFRFLVMAAAEEGKSAAKLSASLDDVLQVLVRTEEYSKLFSFYSGYETLSIFQSLQDNITQLYKRILSFLVRSVGFFEEGTFKRYIHAAVSPFDSTFEPMLKDIKSLESNVEKGVRALERVDELRKENYAWLQSTDYATDIARINSARLEGTCEWFLDSKKFRQWDENREGSNLLWIQGKAGCGKSTIAAQIINREKQYPERLVTSVFCKEHDEVKGKLKSILCGIITQILTQAEEQTRLHSLVHSYRATANTVYPNLTILWAILRNLLSSTPQVRCVIDGLDECSDSDDERADFLRNLTNTFCTSTTQGVSHKVVILTRYDVAISERSDAWLNLIVAASDTDNDTRKYVEDTLNTSPRLSKHPKRDVIYQYLTENASGMILWAKLMLSELEIGHRSVERVLDRVPKGLSDVYSTVLTRLSSSETLAQWDQILAVLGIVSTAARPLSVKELAVILAIWESASDADEHVKPEIIPYTVNEVLETIGMASPLVVITTENTVEIVHASLARFLFGKTQSGLHQNGSNQMTAEFEEGKLHRRMVTALCHYLGSASLNTAMDAEESGSAITQLHEYGCRHLIYHASHSLPLEDAVSSLASYFGSQGGWRWLFAMSIIYSVRNSQLQILQSEFRQCITLSKGGNVPTEQHNLLVFLARQRYKQCLTRSADDPTRLNWARILGSFLFLEGYWNEAEQLQTAVLESRETNLGRDHRLVWAGMDELSSTYAVLGRWADAERLQQRLLDRISQIRPPDHDQVLSAKNSLAIYKEGLYKLDEAQILYEELFNQRVNALGETHRQSITAANNLATLYHRQGKPKESNRLYTLIEASLNRTSSEMNDPDNLTLMGNLAVNYGYNGQLDKAENLAQKAVELGGKILGPEHPETLDQHIKLAHVYSQQYRHDEAEKLYRSIAKSRERVLGFEHGQVLHAKHGLAITLIDQSKLEEAEEILLQVVESKNKTFGKSHPRTLVSLTSLASVYEHQGRYKESENLSVEILDTQKTLFGEQFPDTVDTMVNLASVKNSFGKYDEAIDLMQTAVKFQVLNHGELHPRTLRLRHNLNVYLYNAGKFDASSTAEEELLEARIAKLGPENPSVLMAKHGLIYQYELRGDLPKAEETGATTLEACRRVLGNTHTTTLVTIRSLAGTCRLLGKLEQARTLGEEGLQTIQELHGLEWPDTILYMGDLAYTYRRCGKFEKAYELGTLARTILNKVLGPDHPWVSILKIRLAQTARRLGRIEESEELALEALEAGRQLQKDGVLDPKHSDVQKLLSTFSSIKHAQGRYQEAEDLREQVLAGKKHFYGDKHYETLLAMAKLAQTYKMDPTKLEEAEKLATDAAASLDSGLGAKHPARLFTLSVLASIYREQGKAEQALALQREVVKGRKEVLGEDHPDTKLSLDELATYQVDGEGITG